MSRKDRWNREVIPVAKDGVGPHLINPARTAAHVLGYAVVGSMKLIISAAGEVAEFGTAIIIGNDGSKKKTKR